MESANDGNSLMEEGARSLLESIIYQELPDVEIDWEYDPKTMDHTCKVTKQDTCRTYSFTKEMLVDFGINPEKSAGMIRGVVAEIKRYLP